MTPDPALDKVVCEFLGIAPQYQAITLNDDAPDLPAIYPPVSSTWEGSGWWWRRCWKVG